MNDVPSVPSALVEDKRGLLQRIAEFLHPGPDSPEELANSLAQAEDRQVIGPESRLMLEGVLRLANMTAADVMVPVKRMDVLDINASYQDLLNSVIQTAHSRFPVYEEERDNIIGILMSKDLLKLQRAPELNLRVLLRPPFFVPESKNLNDLLREFRARRNHMAIVIDEFGRLAGLVTIEDVLEEIVGEIDDEFDEPEEDGSIFRLVDGSFRVSGDTSVERINEHFNVTIETADPEDAEQFDTIGGVIAHEMGHVPKRGEYITLAGLNFIVMHSQHGAVRWFKVTPAVVPDA